MQPESLLDATSALIVVVGTCLATILRCGTGDVAATLKAVADLRRTHFDAARVRAELAVQVREIQRDGVIRAEPRRFGDAEFDEASDALIGTRSVSALRAAHKEHKRRRSRLSVRAVMTLNQAADLSPVFGLAGTLISLTQLPVRQDGDFTAAISMAVLTTLYGLLLGNMVFAPLSRAVARRAVHEEQARQRVLEWLESQVTEGLPAAPAPAVRRRPTLVGQAR
ncbi:MotA/TolQ/ExbB proton channel family protein [Novosphingobium sp.]|uniref:MotA/TolQ/ExbB proton channel family protein n=1 Tax=Novosphingobium sp. TaxID=1874826 RepID=UPI002B48D741|nr:MotA/TolQ/ExbB proton channel family protein [Novosphingobium sp.]HKR91734.1 MotA/TolQ/ExbB proton channel family protein [Novosphingobium sp.]